MASVAIEGEVIGEIGRGWLILLGVGRGDTEAAGAQLAEKVALLRCFEDAEGKTNLAAADVGAEMLVVSQFTLYADTSRGRRPGFTNAADPAVANQLYQQFAEALRVAGVADVQTGSFGAEMAVELVNDGPFTIWLDTGG